MYCGKNAGYIFIHYFFSFFMEMIHESWLQLFPSTASQLTLFVLTDIEFRNFHLSLSLTYNGHSRSNTHHHFAIQCTFSFCEFSPPQNTVMIVIIIIIISLPQSYLSLSLITIATSGGRQLKYLKLKASKKSVDIYWRNSRYIQPLTI